MLLVLVQDADLMAVMHAADLDGDGCIDYEEFIVSTINLSKLNKQVLSRWTLTCLGQLQSRATLQAAGPGPDKPDVPAGGLAVCV